MRRAYSLFSPLLVPFRAWDVVQFCAALIGVIALVMVLSLHAQTPDVVIARDGLAPGWNDWSWCDRDVASRSLVHKGTSAVAVSFRYPWSGLYFHADAPLAGTDYERLEFWVHGGTTGGQRLRLVVNGDDEHAFDMAALTRQWTLVSVSLRQLGSPSAVQDLYWQDVTGSAQPTFYLDDVVLVAGAGTPPPPPEEGPTLTIDTTSDRAPINPLIYGMNFADDALARELSLPVNRWGGNAVTRYNWKLDVQNRAGDWYYENIPNEVARPSQLPDGSSSDRFVEANRARGTETILTIPTIGWTPRSFAESCGFSVERYGPQQSTDPWRPDCGNGLRPNGEPITGNDPTDTSLAVGPSFASEWIAHLRRRFGSADEKGVRYYQLDNEPELWNSTHRDVHPEPLGYDELLQRSVAYAKAIKSADARALTLGPVGWGWVAYFYSAADTASGGEWWTARPDRRAHDDLPLVEWYLREMRAQSARDGRRLLDMLDLHYYPQAAGVSLQPAGGVSTQSLRLRSTRSLWDPTYADESWIQGSEGGPSVQLIPRMRSWVDTYYPGTKLALTEYNFGGLEHVNGALAQADVLGIFGREGLDLATLWGPPSADQPGAFAFRMYRNYDAAGSRFGETRVRAQSTDQGKLSVYAAERTSDRVLTVMVVNKASTALVSTLQMSGASLTGAAQVYRYSDADLAHIVKLSPVAIAGRQTLTFPARSMTLFEIPQASSTRNAVR